jgi:membrane fusion protein (multidrug efflux system)
MAKLANQDGRLKPGLFARASVVIGENDKAFVVPEKAIDRNGNEESVFTVVRNTAVKVPVITGVRDSGRVEILKGLKAKDRVIVAGNMNIKDGYPVAVNKTTVTDKK